jgi:hypothetical protein
VDVWLRYVDGEQRCQAAVGVVPKLSSLQHATFHLPRSQAKELKIWIHRLSREGESQRLPAVVEVSCEGELTPKRFDLAMAGEQILVPAGGAACSVEISPAAGPAS